MEAQAGCTVASMTSPRGFWRVFLKGQIRPLIYRHLLVGTRSCKTESTLCQKKSRFHAYTLYGWRQDVITSDWRLPPINRIGFICRKIQNVKITSVIVKDEATDWMRPSTDFWGVILKGQTGLLICHHLARAQCRQTLSQVKNRQRGSASLEPSLKVATPTIMLNYKILSLNSHHEQFCF